MIAALLLLGRPRAVWHFCCGFKFQKQCPQCTYLPVLCFALAKQLSWGGGPFWQGGQRFEVFAAQDPEDFIANGGWSFLDQEGGSDEEDEEELEASSWHFLPFCSSHSTGPCELLVLLASSQNAGHSARCNVCPAQMASLMEKSLYGLLAGLFKDSG